MASRDDGWGGGEDGSSLFEGMVLFAPEPTAAEDSVPAPAPAPAPAEDSVPVPAAVPELPSAARHDADAASSVPPPLDEDLFSDLTLFAPPQEPLSLEQTPPPLLPQGEDRSHAALAPAPLAPTPGLSRQPSTSSLRKKKRAVRIGYARSPQPAPPSPPATVPASAAAAAISASTIAFLDASPYPAATRTLDQLPDRQLDVHVNGYEAHAEAVDVDTNSPHVVEAVDVDTNSPRVEEEEAKEDDDGKEDEDAGVAALGVKERLGLLRSQISGKLDSIQQRAAAVAAKRRLLAGRRRKVAEEATSVASRHKDLERELEVACEAEDFERAESISDSLAALEKEKDGLLTALRDAELDYDSVDSELQEVLESRIAAEEEAAILLEQFAKDANEHAISESKQAQELSSKEIEGWQTSMELLETKKLEMEVETQLVLEARSGLEGSIEHLVEEDKLEEGTLSIKGEVLTKELADLLELVRLKKQR
uniref:UVR domain-containing protein n=1 Tax=Zea mays TaxID=4577 RepID=C0PE60_MAIZE|nr:unknown [Zea mays]|eukprot:NP_001169339.1 uncharacterized protein LOC100383206 isoform 2 [Zea mays]